ncbi:hypothetical protein B7J08_004339 [Salmonella enterica subsp. enterica serovar Eastbourne]|nr:hypothetical protein [Salmonella enterica subsp. enterica serovar Eastbourne]
MGLKALLFIFSLTLSFQGYCYVFYGIGGNVNWRVGIPKGDGSIELIIDKNAFLTGILSNGYVYNDDGHQSNKYGFHGIYLKINKVIDDTGKEWIINTARSSVGRAQWNNPDTSKWASLYVFTYYYPWPTKYIEALTPDPAKFYITPPVDVLPGERKLTIISTAAACANIEGAGNYTQCDNLTDNEMFQLTPTSGVTNVYVNNKCIISDAVLDIDYGVQEPSRIINGSVVKDSDNIKIACSGSSKANIFLDKVPIKKEGVRLPLDRDDGVYAELFTLTNNNIAGAENTFNYGNNSVKIRSRLGCGNNITACQNGGVKSGSSVLTIEFE